MYNNKKRERERERIKQLLNPWQQQQLIGASNWNRRILCMTYNSLLLFVPLIGLYREHLFIHFVRTKSEMPLTAGSKYMVMVYFVHIRNENVWNTARTRGPASTNKCNPLHFRFGWHGIDIARRQQWEEKQRKRERGRDQTQLNCNLNGMNPTKKWLRYQPAIYTYICIVYYRDGAGWYTNLVLIFHFYNLKCHFVICSGHFGNWSKDQTCQTWFGIFLFLFSIQISSIQSNPIK